MTTTSLMDRVLDRTESANPVRLEKYPMRNAGITGTRFRSYSWQFVQLDQGNQGACAGFSETMEAAARPKPWFGDPVYAPPSVAEMERVAFEIYNWARDNDEFPGTHSFPGGEEGTSVDAAARAGVRKKFATGFVWATGTPERMVAQALEAVAYGGPVKVGSHWRAGMWRANAAGFLTYTGAYEGGHAYLLSKTSVARDGAWTPNSWGGDGQGWLGRADLVRMAGEGAEFCIATGRLVR